uniref:DUF4283 domain-containing protein n=1 Tax=Cannabis sativa TaxID=3483 RepID=A0A803Q954_CANSA
MAGRGRPRKGASHETSKTTENRGVSGKRKAAMNKKIGPSDSDLVLKTKSMAVVISFQALSISDYDFKEYGQGDLEEEETRLQTIDDVAEVLSPRESIAQLVQQDIRNFEESAMPAKKPIVKIDLEDVDDEILYWKSAMALNTRDEILNGGFLFFDKKPIIMRSWEPYQEYKKDDVNKVLTWIQLHGLDLRYWGEKSLFKIVEQLGNPIMVDEVTKNKARLNFPRILLEGWGIILRFAGRRIRLRRCRFPKRLGNEVEKTVGDKREDALKEVVDHEGFQKVVKRGKVAKFVEPIAEIANSFQFLTPLEIDQDEEIDNGKDIEGQRECLKRTGKYR